MIVNIIKKITIKEKNIIFFNSTGFTFLIFLKIFLSRSVNMNIIKIIRLYNGALKIVEFDLKLNVFCSSLIWVVSANWSLESPEISNKLISKLKNIDTNIK